MPSFRFEAADATGRIERGTLDADTARGARNQLRARGLTPLQVEDAGAASAQARGWFAPRLTDAELAWATRQMASLLSARLPLEETLSATAEQAERRYLAEVLAGVRSDVRAGHRLADALGSRPRDFPEIYRALVAAGEESGNLAQVMEKLADYIEERNTLQNKVRTAFIYPAIVSLVSVAIVIFLLAYVVPQVVNAFAQSGQALPLLTRVMLGLSEFVQGWGWVALGILVLLAAIWRALLRNPAHRLRWHAAILRLPLAGRFSLGLNAARFASTLAILTGSGVPLLRGLDAARQTVANDRLRADIDTATDRVREGASLAHALKAQGRFPPLLIHLIASGERTGALPELLGRAAQTLSRELERRAMTLTAMMEPLLILAMGGFVLLIVLAVLLPIIEINQLVQ
ncbi:type II secretion system protein GspF [Verticiella sediminum]|uniref:Type II secretion system protein GspF n=1 Tax=Verticiella sediminum TaxID=1247510 RepID=A0A556ACM9_9BURK|nr:type II secretion system inner membrane protein GspF [Verticiella sediminum]TSH90656.1 type II secretion system protein GspF [Verticiella sediminum]